MRLQEITPPVFSLSGTTAVSSAVVTSLAPLYAPLFGQVLAPFFGMPVSGAGIASGATVAVVTSSTQVTLSANATASGTVVLTFGAEPVSLSDAKLHCRIEYDDDDALVGRLITSARRWAETQLRGALITQTQMLYIDSFPSAGGYYNRAIREIWPSLGGLPSGLGFYPGLVPNSTGVIDIPKPPCQSVTSVAYYNFAGTLTTVATAAYNVSMGTPARIQPQYSTVWPVSRPTIDSVMVTFVCGYGPIAAAVPGNIQSAMLLAIGYWYENRELAAEGAYMVIPDAAMALLGADDPGIYS
jgi:hypothetical protein